MAKGTFLKIFSNRDGITPRITLLLFGLALLMAFAGTASAAIGIDQTVSKDQGTSSATVATASFSTTSANELLLAFVSTDAPTSGTNTTVTGIAGGGLTWTLVRRTNTQLGTAEIWRAFAPSKLTNVTVTATLSRSTASSMTVMSFTGVDTTGTSGSGAIGATGTGNSSKGAPTTSLVTTRINSLVVGVGNDWDNGISRTPGAGQTVVHQYLSPADDTYWVQRQSSATPLSGTVVTINDTAPSTDRYNLTIAEILAPAASGPSITATLGTPQATTISTAFATALQATVKDASNNPVSNATVTFTAPGSGASGTFAGGINTATTNSSGIAVAPVFTANSIVGSYVVTASTSGAAASASFNLTNNPGLPATVSATGGASQSATIKAAFGTALQATVKDAGNNPVAGVVVTFTAPTSGASGTFAGGVNTATTNSSGIASAPAFTANAVAGGPYNVTASASGATSATFSLTNKPGPATSIVATAGASQSVTVGSTFGTPLQATVTDSGGNLLVGVSVTFTAPASGASGTFSNNTRTISVATDNNGVATEAFTANGTAGGYTVMARAGTIGPANFSLTNNVGPATNFSATGGTSQSATVNTAFGASLQAKATDTSNNPVSGVSVTFVAPGSGASGTFSNGTATISISTDGSGVAAAPFTANGSTGSYTVTASASGLTGSVSFNLTNNPLPPTTITSTGGTSQNATVGTAFSTALAATVTDSSNSPVSGVSVTFLAPGSGASGTFSNGMATITVATDSTGVATEAFTANGTAGGYTVTASASGVPTPASFSLTNNPLPPILGDSNVEISAITALPSGQAQAVQAIATATGSANSLSVYLDSTSAASQIYVGIYADNGGQPGTLLGQGNLGVGGNSKLPQGWNNIAVVPISPWNSQLTINTPYWIAMLGTQGGALVYRAASASGCPTSETPVATTLTALPAQWTTGGGTGSACVASIFATSTPEISGNISGIPAGGGPTYVALTGPTSGTTTANASGNYWLSVLPNGTYTVTPNDVGYKFAPGNQTVSVSSSSVTGINFAALYSISGNVADAGVGIAGVEVDLSGPTTGTATTDALGNYNLPGLANAPTYTVAPNNLAYIFTPTVQPVAVNGGNTTGVNFSAVPAPANYSISGKITLSSLYKVGGGSTVTLSLVSTGAIVESTTADSSGNFNLAGIPNGAYVVTPSNPAALFTPASLDITINGASNSTANFTAVGLVFYDDFTGTSLSPAWTVISRHGEYAQNETECNVPVTYTPQTVTVQPVIVANNLITALTISTYAQSASCGDYNVPVPPATTGTQRHAPASWPYITGDVQWTSLNFTYGTIEIKAKFPSSATSLWPATWLLGANCQVTNIYTADTGYSTCPNLGSGTGSGKYTEVDMTECYGGGWCQFHVANPGFGIGNGCDAAYANANHPVDTAEHTFTTVWSANSIIQYMDGFLITTCNQQLKNPMFLIIQTQTGGSGGTPNNSHLPAQLVIDSVKVTQP